VVDPDDDKNDDLATEIMIMIGESGDGGEDSDSKDSKPGEDGKTVEGDGAGAGEDSDEDGKDGGLSKALAEIAREEAVEADTELGEEAKDEMSARKLAEKVVDANRRAEGKYESARTFGAKGRHSFGDAHGHRTITKRKPTSGERAASTRLSAELAK